MKRMAARRAGDEIETFADTGHASKIQLGAGLVAARAAQAGQPLGDVRVGLLDGFGRRADLEGIGTLQASGFVQLLGITLIAGRGDEKFRLFADGAWDGR